MNRRMLAGTVSAAAIALGTASAWAQSTTLNGGGASLPEPTYISEFKTYTAANPSALFSYEGVGSGGGQKAFLNNDITQFEAPNVTSSTLVYGTIVGTTVHFGASDAFLTASQLTNPATGAYTLSASDGPLIQLPMIGVGVTLPYVNAGLASTLVLTDTQLCGILSGKLTNWNQISKKATAGTIQVVYRSDSSGTTFLLTNHLNAVCTAANSSFPTLPVPVTKTFAALFANNTPPANFTGESGSQAVATQLLASPLSFGYLSPDYTSIAPKSANTTSLKVASLKNGVNNVTYAPSVTDIELGLTNPGSGSTNATPPSTKSAAQNPLNWVPSIPVANKGYAIVGYTTWEVSSCYADKTAGTQVIGFLNDHFNKAAYQTLLTNNGFAPLKNTSASAYVTAVTTTFIKNGSGYGLNIDNATLCKGLAGR